jgi:hypothetical protein
VYFVRWLGTGVHPHIYCLCYASSSVRIGLPKRQPISSPVRIRIQSRLGPLFRPEFGGLESDVDCNSRRGKSSIYTWKWYPNHVAPPPFFLHVGILPPELFSCAPFSSTGTSSPAHRLSVARGRGGAITAPSPTAGPPPGTFYRWRYHRSFSPPPPPSALNHCPMRRRELHHRRRSTISVRTASDHRLPPNLNPRQVRTRAPPNPT